jgi:hypothetical protein
MTMDETQLNALIDARVNAQVAAMLMTRLKDSGTTGLGIMPHGYNALFNQPGVEPGVMSTLIMPRGIERALTEMGHVQMSMYLNPIFEILTGQTAGTTNEPDGPCDEEVTTPGDLKVCNQTYPFGEFTMKTKPFRVDNAGQLINRSEPLDLRLLNNPFADAAQIIPAGDTNFFRNTLAKAVVELTTEFSRHYARIPITGNIVNNSYVSGGVYGSVFNGLDVLVNTGYADAFTHVACPAADPQVVSGGNAIIQNTAGTTVRRYVEYYRSVVKLADDLRVSDVQWVFLMRYQKFLALTEVWPCAYETYRCTTAAPNANSVVIDISASDQQTMRSEMRKGYYLKIDDVNVPVIIDTTMPETNIGGGNFLSDTYLLPIKSKTLGGQLLYMDYFNYRGPFGMQSVIDQIGPQDEYRVSPDGRFAIFFMGGTAFCKQVMIRTRKRLILKAPFLAVKIEDEAYAVYVHEREWEPGTSFYVDGGATSFAGATLYNAPS